MFQIPLENCNFGLSIHISLDYFKMVKWLWDPQINICSVTADYHTGKEEICACSSPSPHTALGRKK
jgi:hypothetical protein